MSDTPSEHAVGDFNIDNAIKELNLSGTDLCKQGCFTGFHLKMMARWLTELKTLREKTECHPIQTDPKVERQWNKLSDVRPLTSIPVLILAKIHYTGEPIICTATFDGKYWLSHGASGLECENDFDASTITHWMPLPEQPKE